MKLLPYKIFISLLFISALTRAKDNPEYAVDKIPKELLENADAVVRANVKTMELVDLDKVTTKEIFVITILKESGKEKGYFTEFYSKLIDISDVEATVFDQNGKKIKRIKLEDINDYSAISGASLYEDSRVKFIDPVQNNYPYTVEYSFERKYKSAYYLTDWSPLKGYNTSIESASCSIIVPSDYHLKTAEKNISPAQITTNEEGQKVFSWKLKNYPALAKEPLSAPLETWTPVVLLAPSKFKLDNFEGDLNSWNTFGKFVYNLNEGRGYVPEETIQKLSEMLKDGMSDYEKIETIYQYAQQKNRYINIAIGIGGLQTFPAETVDRLSYGDCKALSNYTASLLRNFGYNAYFTLVHAGDHDFMDTTFVKHYFNHAIVSVPLKNDTVWLECTSSFNPAGYLGDFTDDRYVLLVKEKGGELVKTPGYTLQENRQVTTGNVTILTNGTAKANYTSSFNGATYSDNFGLTLMDETDRRKSVIKSIDLPNFDLQGYNLKPENVRHPKLDRNIQVTIPGCATSMGSKFFLPLNTLNALSNLPPYSRNRKSPLLWERNYSEVDSIIYIIPEGYSLDALPDEMSIESQFGAYHFSAKSNGDQIIYSRYFELKKGEYPKEAYNDFIEFLEEVAKGDKSQAIFSKKG